VAANEGAVGQEDQGSEDEEDDESEGEVEDLWMQEAAAGKQTERRFTFNIPIEKRDEEERVSDEEQEEREEEELGDEEERGSDEELEEGEEEERGDEKGSDDEETALSDMEGDDEREDEEGEEGESVDVVIDDMSGERVAERVREFVETVLQRRLITDDDEKKRLVKEAHGKSHQGTQGLFDELYQGGVYWKGMAYACWKEVGTWQRRGSIR